ncbi:hypothetical protein F2P81_006666 [Scophthalmus maximus]|uniref:Uncharacterized protein n=1 Tax=Scophthalmus maximus TaxID=52904 RepID=A0A6A4T8S4_SCOMX|nr:hypothetical protein F2P81_006666 [Scophthalmus maximus]
MHSFDVRTPFRQILTYRQWKTESEGHQVMNVLLAAFRGDVQSLRRYFLSGVDINAVDYNGRSALHVADAEGHAEVIRFLLENAGANPALKDRRKKVKFIFSEFVCEEVKRCAEEEEEEEEEPPSSSSVTGSREHRAPATGDRDGRFLTERLESGEFMVRGHEVKDVFRDRTPHLPSHSPTVFKHLRQEEFHMCVKSQENLK